MADEATTETPRPGTFADLSRRMDRMEQRQESSDARLNSLTLAVGRIEANADHAVELSKLRFDALETGQKALDAKFDAFVKRIDSLISGETMTAQGKAMMDQYNERNASFSNKLVEHERRLDDQDLRNARTSGVFASVSGAKAFVLMLAAIASPVITIIALILNSAK